MFGSTTQEESLLGSMNDSVEAGDYVGKVSVCALKEAIFVLLIILY